METDATTLGSADYVVFSLMLVCSASIGIYYQFTGGKQKTTQEYLLADRGMSVLPVSFSLMASFMSAITLLGVAAENYTNGTQFVVINISYIIGTPIAAFVFLPVFFQVGTTSAFEYLELRFGKLTRLVACIIFMLQMILYMSIVLYAPALTLSAVTGLSKWTSVLSIGAVCTFYCTIGGMKAVLWTDVFQSCLMFSAILAVITKGTIDIGSISKVWEIAEEGGRIQFFNFDPDPTVRHTVWTIVIGGIFTYVSVYGINQAQVQRLLTVKDLKESQKALFVNWPLTSILSICTSFSGLVAYAHFYNCDPLLRSRETGIKSPDQILPYFVMRSLGTVPGLPGLFVAGIFSGALSTMSSAINSLAAVTLEDFVRPYFFTKATETRVTLLTKGTAFTYGVLCILLTCIVDRLGGILQASLTIFNVVGGPMVGLYSLGMLFPRANHKGALAGFILSLIVCFWIGFGTFTSGLKPQNLKQSISGCVSNTTALQLTKDRFNTSLEAPLDFEFRVVNSTNDLETDHKEHVLSIYKLSYMWYAGLGWMIAFFVGMLLSVLTGGNKDVDEQLLSPLVCYRKQRKKSVLEMTDYSPCVGR